VDRHTYIGILSLLIRHRNTSRVLRNTSRVLRNSARCDGILPRLYERLQRFEGDQSVTVPRKQVPFTWTGEPSGHHCWTNSTIRSLGRSSAIIQESHDVLGIDDSDLLARAREYRAKLPPPLSTIFAGSRSGLRLTQDRTRAQYLWTGLGTVKSSDLTKFQFTSSLAVVRLGTW